MPNIIMKAPYSSCKIIEVASKTLPDMYKELNISGIYYNLGTGLMLIVQYQRDYEEPNFIFEGSGICGRAFVVRFGKDKIMDVLEGDVEYFLDQITLVGED